ncbi:MAG TPA: hypothetical protein VL988_05625 [Solirubrobacteraceae bacterium]|nr:hypothetical protein [Solirubrobacteraceae bacterium]
MFAANRAILRSALALLIALSLALGALPVVAASGAVTYVKESEADFAKQLAGKEVREVTLNKRLRTMRVTLADGRHFLATYPKKSVPQTIARLQKAGVGVTVLSKSEAEKEAKPKSTHHKIRYIVGAVVVAVIVIVAAVLLINRRRRRD